MIYWYDTTIRPGCPENRDWEAEQKWAIETGFTRDTYIGYQPFDLPSFLKRKKKRPVNGVDLPFALDHLRIYRNPKTKERIAVFHEYPENAMTKYPILLDWCEENGLQIKQMDYSWYYPGITISYMIFAKQDQKEGGHE